MDLNAAVGRRQHAHTPYAPSMTSWWPPSSIAAGMALPGYAESTDYNVVNLAFW